VSDPAALVAAGGGWPGHMTYLARHCHLAAVRAAARARAVPAAGPAVALNNNPSPSSSSSSSGEAVWRPLVPYVAKDLAAPEATLLLCLATALHPPTPAPGATPPGVAHGATALYPFPPPAPTGLGSSGSVAIFASKVHFDLPLGYALCAAAFKGDVLRWHTAFASLRDKGASFFFVMAHR